ncbi:uncharacterized protein [Euphorbia lathyris]|uniref:uncharacterized protein isoform X2 n=1 Tax=Euphorbia lathyris TaxID=212925 RepID=UPI003313563A
MKCRLLIRGMTANEENLLFFLKVSTISIVVCFHDYNCASYVTPSQLFRTPLLRIRSYQRGDAESYEEADGNLDRQSRPAKDIFRNQRDNTTASGNSFLIILAIAVGVAAVYMISFGLKQNSLGSFFGVQCLTENAQSSVGFSFKFFGYRIILPDYAPGPGGQNEDRGSHS